MANQLDSGGSHRQGTLERIASGIKNTVSRFKETVSAATAVDAAQAQLREAERQLAEAKALEVEHQRLQKRLAKWDADLDFIEKYQTRKTEAEAEMDAAIAELVENSGQDHMKLVDNLSELNAARVRKAGHELLLLEKMEAYVTKAHEVASKKRSAAAAELANFEAAHLN